MVGSAGDAFVSDGFSQTVKLRGGDGTTLWSAPYGGGYLALDIESNAFVSDGFSQTVRLRAGDGTTAWTAQYGGGLAVDSVGNVFVNGWTSSYVPIVAKLDADYGTNLWLPLASYGGALVLDSAGNAVVTDGGSRIGQTVKLRGGDGSIKWTAPYGGNLAVDSVGNAFVSEWRWVNGSPQPRVVKLDTEYGTSLWTNLAPYGYLAVDSVGNAFASDGFSQTVKLRAEDGTTMWTAQYGGILAVDSAGNAYVSGWSTGLGQQTVVELDPATGTGLWSLALGSGEQVPPQSMLAVVVDSAGDVYCYGPLGDQSPNTATVAKYVQTLVVDSLNPDSTQATDSGPDLTLTINGSGFIDGATAMWNGTNLQTTFSTSARLTATIPGEYLNTTVAITTATVTVSNVNSLLSNPQVFTISNNTIVGGFQSAVSLPGQSVSVATPNLTNALASGQAAIAATVNNSGTSDYIEVTAASLTSAPASGTIIDVGGGYVNLKVTGASTSDSATVSFYYSSTVMGDDEFNLVLCYYAGDDNWPEVKSSGDVPPVKDMTDNLDNTKSGGRFTVTFDNTSTPTLTQLTGSAFTMALPPTTPPVIVCPANIVASTDPGLCSAVVTYEVTATANVGAATVVSTPPSGSEFPKGTTVVNCIATDGYGNHSSCSFTVTVNDTEKPQLTVPGPLTVRATSINGAVVAFTPTATDNCPGVEVTSSPTSGALFPLGGTTVTVNATDTSGNTASKTFTITVLADVVLEGPLSVNAGTIKGSVELLAGNSVTLNSDASITGDLVAPGTPKLVKNGQSTVQGTIVGSGSPQPSGYSVTLNGDSSLRYLRTRINPISMPAVAAPPAPTGTRNVTLTNFGQSPGDFSTVRNLTLSGNVGLVTIPPGTYGNFTVNGSAGFVLGTAGSSQPAVYNLQNLTLNSTAQVVVVGPVILVLANSLSANGPVGISTHPAWLQLMIASGGVTLNGGCKLAALVTAPHGSVIINGNTELIGALQCNQLTINSGGLLQGAAN